MFPTKTLRRPPPPRRRPVKEAVVPEIAAPPSMAAANKRFVYKPEVVERVGKTYVTIWRWMTEGTFPNARIVGGQIAWLECEIDQWMESRPLRQYKPLSSRGAE